MSEPHVRTELIVLLLLVSLLSTPAWAQQTATVTTEPVSVTVALMGVVLTSAGFGMMLRQDERGSSDTGWLVGGVCVVAAGVTMTYVGLRSRTVTIAPVVSKSRVGAAAIIRWR